MKTYTTHHYWTVIVNQSHIDQETNVIVLGSSIEQMKITMDAKGRKAFESAMVKKEHIFFPQLFEVVSYVEGLPNTTSRFLLEVELPSGKTIEMMKSEAPLGSTGRTRIRVKNNNMPIGGPGANVFKFFELTEQGDKRQLAEVPVYINVDFEDLGKKG